MPFHFKPTGGYFRCGLMYGLGEVYQEDSKTGEGDLYIGNFINGKLNDPNGIYIVYNNTSYTRYSGTFIDHKMDGVITVCEYINTDPLDEEDEKKKLGNGVCGTLGQRFILASNQNKTLNVTKKTIIFSDGIKGAVLSTEPCDMTICIEQKSINGKKYFSKFCIEECA